jgi:hypothetical protein
MGFVPDCLTHILGVSLALVYLGMALATNRSYKAVICLDTHSFAIL